MRYLDDLMPDLAAIPGKEYPEYPPRMDPIDIETALALAEELQVTVEDAVAEYERTAQFIADRFAAGWWGPISNNNNNNENGE